jgi:hypothetical protein
VSDTTVGFRLRASDQASEIEVRLESFKDRWVATVSNGHRVETGLGQKARSALTAAIQTLEPRSAAALLADPELFGVSWRILQAG